MLEVPGNKCITSLPLALLPTCRNLLSWPLLLPLEQLRLFISCIRPRLAIFYVVFLGTGQRAVTLACRVQLLERALISKKRVGPPWSPEGSVRLPLKMLLVRGSCLTGGVCPCIPKSNIVVSSRGGSCGYPHVRQNSVQQWWPGVMLQ